MPRRFALVGVSTTFLLDLMRTGRVSPRTKVVSGLPKDAIIEGSGFIRPSDPHVIWFPVSSEQFTEEQLDSAYTVMGFPTLEIHFTSREID